MAQPPAEPADQADQDAVADTLADGSDRPASSPEMALFGAPHITPGFEGRLVAIGASAGGLDALERLFGGLPTDTGAAFVVVQHLSPDHKSMMDNLLGRYTSMPVTVATQAMPLLPDHVFLIPPGMTMRLSGHHLTLTPKATHGLSLPIDVFFESAAEAFGERAIGVVLSGTGSDGSRGVVALNAAGGFVHVQDPANARFDGMPRSAIATGVADVVATAEQLALRLKEQLNNPVNTSLQLNGGQQVALQLPLEGIFELLAANCGIDFREYKQATVLRRLERRMQVSQSGSLADYLQRLQEDTEELVLLRRELLIPVTRFFRDAEAFEHLAETVLRPLAEQASSEPIRCWVACCATGEEAYTVAMLLQEALRRAGRHRPVKIFATDAEQSYLDHASGGTYPATIAAEVSPERLQRHFVDVGGMWSVSAEVRQMVIFARHNLVADPPFTRMDLVICRNALIYFQAAAQERALRRLQYALAPMGHLVLGPSESLGPLHIDFRTLAGRHKIYQLVRRERPPAGLGLDTQNRYRQPTARSNVRLAPPVQQPPTRVDAGQALLQQSYVPPSLLVSESRELLHVYGDARRYLHIAEGQATLDVLKLLPRELAWAAGLLLQTATETRLEQRSPVLYLPTTAGTEAVADGSAEALQLVARPLDGQGAAMLVLLSFERLPVGGVAVPAGNHSAEAAGLLAGVAGQQQRIELLERELGLTHDTLQATIEELETANEELQATNEELMASNEELQSTNEELQSVNEELYTVNSEYQEKVDILNAVNADLENISRAASIPTLFVDESLMLSRFTPEAALLFKVREGDVGRSLEDFAHQLDYPSLFTDLRRTLETSLALEREVQSRSGDWWLARMQPYRGRGQQRASRAVLTFVNISSLKDSQRLQAVLDSMPAHVAVIDQQGTITLVNAAWRRFAQHNGDSELRNTGTGSNYLHTCAQAALHDADAHSAHAGLTAVLEGRQDVFVLQYPCHSPDQRRWFLMHAAPLTPRGGAVVSHIDITTWLDAAHAAPQAQQGPDA